MPTLINARHPATLAPAPSDKAHASACLPDDLHMAGRPRGYRPPHPIRLNAVADINGDVTATAPPIPPATLEAIERAVKPWRGRLLTVGNPKTEKGESLGYLTAILHLAPATLAGFRSKSGLLVTVCAKATAGCIAACLNTAGRGGIFKAGESTNAIQEARIGRTLWYFTDRESFLATLAAEIAALEKKAKRLGLKLAVRLNGTSDIQYEREAAWLFAMFPGVIFYDYTKIAKRFTRGALPVNYRLTYSYSEAPEAAEEARAVLAAGGNVAVVFRSKAVRARYMSEGWQGAPVIDGDATDLRFLDAPGAVVGLYAKGRARRDASGFVID